MPLLPGAAPSGRDDPSILSSGWRTGIKRRTTSLRVTVDVKAGSREEGLEKLGEDWYLVRVKAPRKKGKANAAVLKILQRHFGGRARIIRGFTATRKIIELEE